MKCFQCLNLVTPVLMFGLMLSLASCTIDSAEDGGSAEVRQSSGFPVRDHICGASPPRRDYCPTDFVRLAVDPTAAGQKEIWILGYLVVDDGEVVLYANEDAYRNMEYGRSIRVEGPQEELSELISDFGYRSVRLGGTFYANSYSDPRDDRLGHIVSPVKAKEAQVRLGEREGAGDIAIK